MKHTHRILVVLSLAFAFVIVPTFAHASVIVYNGGEPYAYVVPDAIADGVLNPQSSGISSQVPSMQRACYLADPTAFPSYWRSGQYDSPEDNSVIIYDSLKNSTPPAWYKTGAKHNNHIKELDCSTNATADTSLSASKTVIAPGESTTLTWASQYGKLRQATCTAENFTLETTVPGHFETVLVDNPLCSGGGILIDPTHTQEVMVPTRSQFAGCVPYLGQVWVPEYTGAAPYGGSKDVSPTETTTYTYTCTNDNGSSSSSVTVVVSGTEQCSDGIDNDNDGLIDAADPGCAVTPPGSPGGSPGGGHGESADLPDLTASAVVPTQVVVGTSVTLSSTITNGGGTGTAVGFTNVFQIDNDSDHTSVTATKTDTSPSLASGASDATQISYTFPTKGTWYVRACADNDADWHGTIHESNENNNCSSGGWSTITVANQSASLSADPVSVSYGTPSTLTWACANAASATIAPTIGAVSPVAAGDVPTGNLFETTTYTLTCAGEEVLHAYTSVSVIAPTLTLYVTPPLVRPGGSTTVTWEASAGAKGCTVSGWGILTSHAISGNADVNNIQNSHTYTLTCNGAGSKSATVNILPSYIEK